MKGHAQSEAAGIGINQYRSSRRFVLRAANFVLRVLKFSRKARQFAVFFSKIALERMNSVA